MFIESPNVTNMDNVLGRNLEDVAENTNNKKYYNNIFNITTQTRATDTYYKFFTSYISNIGQ